MKKKRLGFEYKVLRTLGPFSATGYMLGLLSVCFILPMIVKTCKYNYFNRS